MIPERLLNRTIKITNPNGSGATTTPSGDIIKDYEVVVTGVKMRIYRAKPDQAEALNIGLIRKQSTHKGMCNPLTEINNNSVKVGYTVTDLDTGDEWTIEDIEATPGGASNHHNELWLNEVK